MTRHVTTSGLIDVGSDLYIQRGADDELYQHLLARRSTLVVGCRCMGKTSLANYVGQWLELGHRPDELASTGELELDAAGRFRMATVDLDSARVALDDGSRTSQRIDSILHRAWRSLRTRGYDPGEAPAPGTTLVDGLCDLADVDPERPLLVVVDEFDRLANIHGEGAEVVHAFRGLLQELRRERALRERLVLCILSVRGAPELFERSVQDPSAGLELHGEVIQLGPFDISDRTTEQLAAAFEDLDPANATNLALKVIEVSGGYPQLCMELAARTLEERVAYGPDFDRFLMDQVEWMKHWADPIRRRFFDLFEAFVAEEPRLGIAALHVYRRLLLAYQGKEPELEFDGQSEAQRLLKVAGLARISADHRLRVYSPFLARYFDLEWADGLRNRLAVQTRAALAPVQEVLGEGGQTLRRRPRLSTRRLAVLVTGGTIGMVERDGRVRPPDDADELADEYRELGQLYDVDWYPVASLDSANVGPRQWSEWSREVADRVADYDGVVVAHGTDTLAFTASAVAFALGKDLDVPVVFTGSQTTVDIVSGDARTNLLRACQVAAAPERPSALPEVVISFGENIFRAVRAIKRDDRRFEAFESPAYPPLGTISEDVTLYQHLIRDVEGMVPGVRTTLEVRDQFASGVLVISQAPGAHADYYLACLKDRESRPRGIVIQSLGAGNIPTEGQGSLVPLIYKACELGIPVLLAGQYPIYPANLGRYGPPRRAIAAGAIPVANMTTAALVSKFSWVLARLATITGDRLIAQVRAFMLTNQVGEVDDQDLAALGRIDLDEIRADLGDDEADGSPGGDERPA